MPDASIQAREVIVRGIVQGVGFRPFVFQLAHALGVRGWVLNGEAGVRIHAEGTAEVLDAFEATIRVHPPPAAVVNELTSSAGIVESFVGFEIRESERAGAPSVRISPDLCVCAECVREMRDAADPRHGYEYINCTNCGPRYSIIESLPYDRVNTTMHRWALCAACEEQYKNPRDRRFHAQPVACPLCGPRYRLVMSAAAGTEVLGVGAKANTSAVGADAIACAAAMLNAGRILAVKGIGGFHLACDARNGETVALLRARKFRKDKPFALMVRSLDECAALVHLSDAHTAALLSPARPIVLVPAKVLLADVAPGIDELGLMLPYAPLHHLLFDAGAPSPLVLTSANRSSEPICYRDDDALDRLGELADAFLIGDRPIARRVDDSVVAVRGRRPMVIRRGRGLAPSVVATLPGEHTRQDRPILAVGADLKNAIALVVRGEVILSQHIGDLGDVETDRAFDETIRDLLAMYEIDAASLVIAHDLHPQFTSTARALALRCKARVAVQHHEAHVASLLAERGLYRERVVGVALDGTGYGRDGSIWGGEIFVGGIAEAFTRVDHLRVAPMPGGDAAARFPVHAAAGRLHGIGAFVPELAGVDLHAEPFSLPKRYADACALIERNVRCFSSSSAGRVFDAAAALLGFTDAVTYEGQAAIWLEQLATSALRGSANTERVDDASANADAEEWRGRLGQYAAVNAEFASLDDRPLLARLIRDRLAGRPLAEIAVDFHIGFSLGLARAAARHGHAAHIHTIALSGGVLQNALVLGIVQSELERQGFTVLTHQHVPPNDGGIAVGQAALAAFQPLA
jgi:hydrogenase maturation protein HypF